jgi:hypothetical protein
MKHKLLLIKTAIKSKKIKNKLIFQWFNICKNLYRFKKKIFRIMILIK